jgi:hypothetical protein
LAAILFRALISELASYVEYAQQLEEESERMMS